MNIKSPTLRSRAGMNFVAGGFLVLAVAGASMWPAASGPSVTPAAAPTADLPAADATRFEPGPDNVIGPEGLPAIGKWMISPDGSIAHWLDATFEGKHIREPINVILLDAGATSADDARARLESAVAAAGYPSRRGHSGGYGGWIDGRVYPQLPDEPHHAFSNLPYVLDNNHGRIFGPAEVDDGYLFIGAFSRERIAPFDSLKHQYDSFDRARDDFTQKLDATAGYRIVGFVDLDNALVGDPAVTTGDHDGQAVMLRMD